VVLKIDYLSWSNKPGDLTENNKAGIGEFRFLCNMANISGMCPLRADANINLGNKNIYLCEIYI